MANIICHNNGRYNIYSTVSDSFLFERSISLDELTCTIRLEHGCKGISELPERLERAHKFGTSAVPSESLDDLMICNRAGENESHLTTQQCIERFLS